MSARRSLPRGLLAATALLAFAACAPDEGVRNNAATRAFDRTAGTDVSGAYPDQRDGTPGNPPGTMATRALDRAFPCAGRADGAQGQKPASTGLPRRALRPPTSR